MNMDFLRPKKRVGNADAIKTWVRDALGLADDATVMVSELACHEEDCPPLETVVAVFPPGAQKLMFKIHRATAELTPELVGEMIRNGHR